MDQYVKWIRLLQLILNFTILGVIIYYYTYTPKEIVTKEYWQDPNFKTDSIKVEIDYSKLPKPTFTYNVPPAKVIEYQVPSTNGISLKYQDSLIQVIDSLKDQIFTINALYLKLYPHASKLIYGEFKGDSLQLDFLNTEGRLLTSKVAVNYAKFQYQYKDGNFRAQEVRTAVSSKGLHGALFGYAGYNVISTSPLIGADYSITKGKLRLGANSFLTIETEPKFYLMGTAGFRLYGN